MVWFVCASEDCNLLCFSADFFLLRVCVLSSLQLKYVRLLLYMSALVAPVEQKWLYLCLDLNLYRRICVQFHVISVMFVNTFGFLLMYSVGYQYALTFSSNSML